jgi:hypothetical protein
MSSGPCPNFLGATVSQIQCNSTRFCRKSAVVAELPGCRAVLNNAEQSRTHMPENIIKARRHSVGIFKILKVPPPQSTKTIRQMKPDFTALRCINDCGEILSS